MPFSGHREPPSGGSLYSPRYTTSRPVSRSSLGGHALGACRWGPGLPVPMSFNSAGAGTAFQLGGKADSGSSVTGTSSGNDARIEIRSPGAVCAETCTNISRTASERCSDVYIIGYPLWFHRPPASWAPMPLNAVASCFARHSRHSSMASCTPRSRFDGGHRARPQSRWLCPGGR